MECPVCHFAQAADSLFCDQCGADLEPTCPECGAANRVGARFCRKCRTNLSGDATVASPKPTPVAEAPPKPAPHLAARILNSAAALEGERKLVTVLFADVKGSMDLAEQMDAEEWSAIMQRFFRILSEGVERFEGFVDKFTGDGIMALFGAPIAHEDHARRACYASLHLRENLKRYADELRRTTGLSFSVRMGLNSGEVVVGKIGDDLRMDYTAQGHTVGLAQRMEQRAAADSAYLTEHTAALVKGYFDLRDLGRFDLKGASAPIGGFELLGVGAHRTRLDRSRERGFSRLVGRAGELATLEAALDRAMQGRGGAVGVVADAGVGKSRLCMEFVERCRARSVAVYDTHCPSHGQAVPLLPILDLFRGYFGVTSRDSDQDVREKIAGRVVLLDRALQDFLPLAFDFLGVADPAQPVAALEPAVRQRQLIAFTRLLVQSRSVREPAVLFVDDAHWIDPSSDAFLAEVAEIVPGTRTMLLLNFRPEYSAEWMARPSYQQLPLHPLGSEALDELLEELLGGDSSMQSLRGLIRERSGGNPFFVEEIVQALCESGKLLGEPGARRLARPLDGLDLPPTVQGILAGRIDRLSEREKTLLQTAAVIGRKFSASLLLRVSGLSEPEFAETVATLRHAEFLQEESLYPDVEYAFRHPLTHEVAEGSQLSVQRRRIHLAVARVLEELHADKPGEHSALLAHHWDLGGEAEPATRWHQRAAEWIAGSNASEARRHWERVRDLAEKMENPELALPLGQRSRVMLLEYAWRFGVSPEEADEMLREGEDWARRHHREHSLAAFYNAFSIPCAFSGNPRRARELATEGLRLAEQAGDRVLACALELRLFFVAWSQGLVADMAAAMDAVLRHGDDDQRRASSLVGYDVPSTVAGYRGSVCVLAGQLHSALEHFHRGIELSRACEAPEVESWMHWVESDLWYERGEAARALASARQSHEIAERIDNPMSIALALAPLGRALLLSGDATSAIEVLTRADALLDRLHRPFQVGVVADLARAYCAVGDLVEAKAVAQRSLAMAEQQGAFEGEVRARFALAGVQMLQGGEASYAEALALLDVAQSRAEQIGLGVIAPHLTELRGEIARCRGDHVAAEAAFEQAGKVFQEMGATGHVRRLAERPNGERPGR